MKAIILILIFSIFIFNLELQAQDLVPKKNSIVVSPFGIMAGKYAKLRVRFQHSTKNLVAYGGDIKYFFSNEYPGFQILPFVKLFPSGNTNKGFYFYLTGVYGKNKNIPDDKSVYYDNFGAGLGVGWILNLRETNNGLIDLSFGFKNVHTNGNLTFKDAPDDYDDFFIIGPASIFDGIIAIGFRF